MTVISAGRGGGWEGWGVRGGGGIEEIGMGYLHIMGGESYYEYLHIRTRDEMDRNKLKCGVALLQTSVP